MDQLVSISELSEHESEEEEKKMHIPNKKQTNYFAEPLEPILPT